VIEWHTGDPPDTGDEFIVWCGWATAGSFLPRKLAARPSWPGSGWYSEPAGINPIFHVTHWAVVNPPKGTK